MIPIVHFFGTKINDTFILKNHVSLTQSKIDGNLNLIYFMNIFKIDQYISFKYLNLSNENNPIILSEHTCRSMLSGTDLDKDLFYLVVGDIFNFQF